MLHTLNSSTIKITVAISMLFCGLSLFSASCQNQADTAKITTKGYELYSWRLESGTWYYALVLGTNRLKTDSELVAVQKTSLDSIEKEIRTFSQGEYIFWNTNKDQMQLPLVLPEKNEVDRIKRICSERNINLSI